MIRFREDMKINVATQIVGGNITEDEDMTFKKGDTIDAEIYNEDGDYVDIGFASGWTAEGVLKDSIEVI